MSGRKRQTVSYVDLRDVPCDRDEWLLDKGRALKGEWNILAGEGGSGKTTTIAAWIAELTTRRIPIIYLGERSLKGLRKRLIAAGADFDYIRSVELREFVDLRRSVDRVEAAVEDGFEVLILDPLSHFLPIESDSRNDANLRAMTRPISDLVARSGLTIIALHHVNKNEGASAIHRLTGSTWFKDNPALVLGLGPNPLSESQRALVTIKTNADDGVLAGALLYEKRTVRITVDGTTFAVARSVLVGESSSLTRDKVFARITRRGEERRDAAELLRDALACGPISQENVAAAAEAAGLSWRTVERASKEIGVEKKPIGYQQPWAWALPNTEWPESATPSDGELCESGGGLCESGGALCEDTA
jgi:putative DNA primase/helicase